MKLMDTFTSFNGRISRSDFFVHLCSAYLFSGALMGLGIALLSSGTAIAFLYGILIIALAVMAAIWSTAALLIRRMHDLNLSAGHAACVYGVDLIAFALAAYNPSIGVVVIVFVVGTSIWFLSKSGTPGRNRFGSPTRARRASPPAS
jgi:uncharacterized membrane protein YhaH (DUF805 family)